MLGFISLAKFLDSIHQYISIERQANWKPEPISASFKTVIEDGRRVETTQLAGSDMTMVFVEHISS